MGNPIFIKPFVEDSHILFAHFFKSSFHYYIILCITHTLPFKLNVAISIATVHAPRNIKPVNIVSLKLSLLSPIGGWINQFSEEGRCLRASCFPKFRLYILFVINNTTNSLRFNSCRATSEGLSSRE